MSGRPGLLTPRLLVRLEGLTALVVGVFLYARSGESWLMFALLLLAPDLSIAAYLAGSRAGATAYNLFHNYVGPAAVVIYGIIAGQSLAIGLSLIWIAHIGGDRLLGFGLKYPSDFKDTHIQRL